MNSIPYSNAAERGPVKIVRPSRRTSASALTDQNATLPPSFNRWYGARNRDGLQRVIEKGLLSIQFIKSTGKTIMSGKGRSLLYAEQPQLNHLSLPKLSCYFRDCVHGGKPGPCR